MELLIGDVFDNAARAVPDRVAVALGADRLTFAEVDQRANQTARALAARGVGHRDLVAVWSATCLDTVPAFAALAKLGAVFVPLNPRLGIIEAVATLRAARPTLLLTDAERAGPGVEVAGILGVATVDHGALWAAARRESDNQLREPALVEQDPHVVFFTSGSSGRAKGVVLSHRVNFLRSHPGALPERRGAMVCPYPLFHMGGWTIALQQWQARDRVVFVDAPDAPSICAAIDEHRAARLNCIPGVWRRILDYLHTPAGARHDLSSLRFADTGTSATPPDLLEAIGAAFPAAEIRVFYGSTEAGSAACLTDADVRRKPGSCGVPAPLTELRVAPDGEVWVRGPLLFDGYFEDPLATAAALVGGWYRTGDLGDVDGDGYLTIVGRVGELIRTGGESVAPADVEAVLSAHPAIADVAVVGIADAEWGEVVCAVVVAADPIGGAPGLEELRAWCGERLAPHKQPRRLAVVASIPRTSPTNQVQRRLLVEQVGAIFAKGAS